MRSARARDAVDQRPVNVIFFTFGGGAPAANLDCAALLYRHVLARHEWCGADVPGYFIAAIRSVTVNGLASVESVTHAVTNDGATSNSSARMVVSTALGMPD